ncbi:MAG: hypothetical protein IPH12_00600 [Saprospirales bacterium]|nr:hypothetical protein [Saprospirales bacterium]
MKPARCLVVDDEELARTPLQNYIGRLTNLQLIASCPNPLGYARVAATTGRLVVSGYSNA